MIKGKGPAGLFVRARACGCKSGPDEQQMSTSKHNQSGQWPVSRGALHMQDPHGCPSMCSAYHVCQPFEIPAVESC